MLIKQITLYNYRLYQWENKITFDLDSNKNIYIISGQNGFGKTTFLHSLIWCLYGKLSSEVEISIRKELQNGGYANLLKTNLNNDQIAAVEKIPSETINRIKKRGYTGELEEIKKVSQYYVEIVFSDIAIPSIPCNTLSVKRGYDIITDKEFVEILIDGKQNELANVIGSEMFINDFILNKDIARFFFFDSEQIVSLAETNTPNDRKKLCSAYNEVLGVRKYEDLKNNLDNIRIRFRRRSSDVVSKCKIENLSLKKTELEKELEDAQHRVEQIDNKISSLSLKNDELQMQLAREGNGATIDEIKRLKQIVEISQRKSHEYKQLLKSYLDYAPLAICGNLLMVAKARVEHDFVISSNNASLLNKSTLVSEITSALGSMLHDLPLKEDLRQEVVIKMKEVMDRFRPETSTDKTLFNVSDSDFKEFESVITYVTSTYKAEFERLADDYKKNKQILERNTRQLSIIESKEKDSLIKNIRDRKNSVEFEINSLNSELRELLGFIGEKNQELSTIKSQLTTLLKNIDLDDLDSKKDELAMQLSSELSSFLTLLKQEKKFSLEHRIKTILNSLMHKDDFIHRVVVNISSDEMDILLLAKNDVQINKEVLSKGEQQLYATSILKALVEESGIKFPVFIDSPLQKFDKTHASRIITEFYPSISRQVVLFPLLYKEITPEELSLMKPFVKESYIIQNNVSHSTFERIDIDKLMPMEYV